MKGHIKPGNLYTARTTCLVQSHMLRVTNNYTGPNKYTTTWCMIDGRQHWLSQLQDKDLTEEEKLLAFVKNLMGRRREKGLVDVTNFSGRRCSCTAAKKLFLPTRSN